MPVGDDLKTKMQRAFDALREREEHIFTSIGGEIKHKYGRDYHAWRTACDLDAEYQRLDETFKAARKAYEDARRSSRE